MLSKARYSNVLCVALLLTSIGPNVFAADKGDHSKKNPGETLYQTHCAHCHNGTNPRAPQQSVLLYMSSDSIYKAMSEGPMQTMAQHLSDTEQRRIAEYLSWGHHKVGERAASPAPVQCNSDSSSAWFDYSQHPPASGWGITNTRNTRFIPADVSRLPADKVGQLKLKWAFAFPDTNTPRSQPAFAGGALFVGAQNGYLYALDASSGCLRWQFKAKGEIRTAISVSDWKEKAATGPGPLLYFGDGSAHTYAVSAVTGQLVWKRKMDDHPAARLTGAPTLQQDQQGNRLYVPVSTIESPMTGKACCTFRGSVSALNADTGEVIWKSYVIPSEPVEQYKTAKGESILGPAGAGVWTSPTLDSKRGLLYVGTGENSTWPATNGGAIVAMNLRDGKIAWVVQPYGQEAYNHNCYYDVKGLGRLCPPDFKGRLGLDVSSSPMLIRDESGREIIAATQKPGDIYGLDPDNKGRILWRRRISRGDYNLGVMFGMAAEGNAIFASVMDLKKNPQQQSYWGVEELGLYAMDAFTGEPLWQAPVSDHCNSKLPCRGYSAALTAIPGVLFAGAKDGLFRAFDSRTGKALWEFDTTQQVTALNGEKTHGGDIDGPGAVVVNGMVYINSGYVTGNSGIKPGNVFLAFSVNGK